MIRYFIGFCDDNGERIYEGDELMSEYGYHVIVTWVKGEFVGMLVCDDDHSCKDIPYALNGGKGFTRLK